ncbi:hypothetical protein L6227_02910 [Pseudomonas syringae pv. syringae]|uniref:hypothetical protein n=1 Tax=Pseudomonas syringae TaxID=317 RepID=UPI001F0D744E|nr:hypothetical protein [Pseudomonas syringae]MCH5548247.1 hypothetical protein [Pseudomonas syringae pv. syringae]
MVVLGVIKILCGSAAAIFGLVSCLLWFKSTRAEVLLSDAPKGNTALSYHVDNREIELISSMAKQSKISASAAICAAIAAFMQVILTVIQVSEL